ncbi:MAG: hypothetical protein Q8L57_03445 [bacterium]|nr:hypothetical protein [bacterium]
MTICSFLINLIILLLIIFAPINSASAHLPVFKIGGVENISRAQELFEILTAQMIFGRLQAGKTDFYKFKISEPLNLHIQILTPKRNNEFRPTLVILGPGLKKADEYFPFLIEEGLGAIVLADNKTERETFFDFESLSRYFKGPETRRYLTEAGVYLLAVFEPKNNAGTYAIRLSDKEDWRPAAILNRIRGIFKIKLGLY